MNRLFPIGVLICAAAHSQAAAPRIQFDTAYTAGCRDITDPAFAEANPHERLFEARILVSSLLLEGKAGDLDEFFILINSPRHSLEVVDFLPKTTLASDIAGNIQVESREETSATAGVTVSGVWQELVKGGASADAGIKRSESVKYERLPPKESVAAAGTLARSSGVYFKLRASSQTSLEGGREFVVVFRAPAEWRADVVHVACRAAGIRRGPVSALDERVSAGQAEFSVALYREGDEAARQSALEYAAALHALLKVADRQQAEIERRSLPSLAHRFGKLISAVEGRIPADWTDQLIYHSEKPAAELAEFSEHLPAAARSAAMRFARAKSTMIAHSAAG